MFSRLFGKGKKKDDFNIGLVYDFAQFRDAMIEQVGLSIRTLNDMNARGNKSSPPSYMPFQPNGVFVVECLAFIAFWHSFCHMKYLEQAPALRNEINAKLQICIDEITRNFDAQRDSMSEYCYKIINLRFNEYLEFRVAESREEHEKQTVRERETLLKNALRGGHWEKIAVDISFSPLLQMMIMQASVVILARYRKMVGLD